MTTLAAPTTIRVVPTEDDEDRMSALDLLGDFQAGRLVLRRSGRSVGVWDSSTERCLGSLPSGHPLARSPSDPPAVVGYRVHGNGRHPLLPFLSVEVAR